MIEHKYPYSDAHELNLDWILEQIKGVGEIASSIEEWKSTIEAGIAARELLANKKQSVTNSNTDYPSTQAVRDYVTNFLQSYELLNNKLNEIVGSGTNNNYPTTKAVVDYVNSQINTKLTNSTYPDLITVNKTIIGAINEAASLISNPNIVFITSDTTNLGNLIEYINSGREIILVQRSGTTWTDWLRLSEYRRDANNTIFEVDFYSPLLPGGLSVPTEDDYSHYTNVYCDSNGWHTVSQEIPNKSEIDKVKTSITLTQNQIPLFKELTYALTNIAADGSGNANINLGLPTSAVVKNVTFFAVDELNRFVVWGMNFTNSTAKFGYINHRTSSTNATIKAVVEYVLP